MKKIMFFVSIMWVMNGLFAMDTNDQLKKFNQERINRQEPLKKAEGEITKLKEQNEILQNQFVKSEAAKKIYGLYIQQRHPDYFKDQEEEKKEIERITNLESKMEATQKALDDEKKAAAELLSTRNEQIKIINTLKFQMIDIQKMLDSAKEQNKAAAQLLSTRDKQIEYHLHCLKTKNTQLVYSVIGNLLLTGLVIYLYRKQVIS